MEKTNFVEITVKFNNSKNASAAMHEIHDNLRGLKDYVNDAIVLAEESENNEVILVVGDEASLEGKLAVLGIDFMSHLIEAENMPRLCAKFTDNGLDDYISRIELSFSKSNIAYAALGHIVKSLYWLDDGRNGNIKISLDDKDIVILLSKNINDATKIAIFGNRIANKLV